MEDNSKIQNNAKCTALAVSGMLEEMIKKRTKELEEKTAQLDTSVKVFVGREQKIIQLQDEIKKLKSQINSKR